MSTPAPQALTPVFAALADDTRWRILTELGTADLSASGLADRLPVSRPAVSQHLKVLREAGLVTVRPDGQRRLYAVRPDGLESVERFLADLWPASLERLRRAVEDADGG